MRLLRAAFGLMAEKGRDNVAISEITEAADVGFGSFYYHFESKDGIFAALTEWVFDDFADGLERLASGLSDPAEVVSVCVRHTLLRARRERLWGRFLIREPVGDEGRLPERAAAMVLQTLGLTRAEAKDVANRPLPPGDFTAAESS
nr:TetR/AcrR family transcriptional regulator [Burkholderia ubonensis]